MGAEALRLERRHRPSRLSHGSLDQTIDAEPSKRLSETVQKHTFLRSTGADQSFENLSGLWPKGAESSLVALSQQANGGGTAPGYVPNCKPCDLIRSSTAVVEE
jgi:hypothetical protein